MTDKWSRLDVGDGVELEQVLFAGFKALRWKLPTTAAGEALGAIAAAAAPAKAALIEGLIDDALAVLHHDGDGEGAINDYERGALRRRFTERLAQPLESRKNSLTTLAASHKPLDFGDNPPRE